MLVDRASAQLEINAHMVANRGRSVKRRDVLWARVDGGNELRDVLEIAQRLNSAGGRAGADRNKRPGLASDLQYAPGVLGCGDRAFHQRYIVGPFDRGAGSLDEPGDLDTFGKGQELVFAIEQTKLASVARGKLPHRELGTFDTGHGTQSSRIPSSRSTRSALKTGPSLQIKTGPNWQWPHSPIAHFMLRSIDMYIRSAATPQRSNSRYEKRIITSGPHTITIVSAGSNSTAPNSSVRTPTRPLHPAAARSTISLTVTPGYARHCASSLR